MKIYSFYSRHTAKKATAGGKKQRERNEKGNERNRHTAGRAAAHLAATAEPPARAGQRPAAATAGAVRRGQLATTPAGRKPGKVATRKAEHGGRLAPRRRGTGSARQGNAHHHARASASGSPQRGQPEPAAEPPTSRMQPPHTPKAQRQKRRKPKKEEKSDPQRTAGRWCAMPSRAHGCARPPSVGMDSPRRLAHHRSPVRLQRDFSSFGFSSLARH